jgi:hypothetical protein
VDHPYREGASVARWVCIACHRTLSRLAGSCPRCHVERLDLTRPDVREEVRAYAEQLLYRRMMNEEIAFGVIGGMVGIGCYILTYLLFFSDAWGRIPILIGFAVALGLRKAMLMIYLRLRPDAGIAMYAARARRMRGLPAAAPAALTDGKTPVAADAIDPEVADVEGLLRGLGATVD